MNQVEILLQELCPDGVLNASLGEMLKYEQPGKYLVSSTNYSAANPTPVLTAGQTFILGYTDETVGVYPASRAAPVIIFDDFTTSFKWVDFPFKAKSSAMKMLTLRSGVDANLRYVFLAMQTIRYSPQEHARQWIGTYSQFSIPLPPRPIQNKLVDILDRFIRLEAELEAELEARRQQFSHYRELLLYSSAHSTLGQIGTLTRGRRFTKNDYVPDGIGCIHYGDIYTSYGTSATETVAHVRANMAGALRFAAPGDLVIAAVGETVEDVGKAVAWLGDENVAVHDDCFTFHHEQNPRFVAYWFQTAAFNAEKNRFVARAKVKRLSAESLARLHIPLPQLEEQERIVSILDKFDALVNDLSSGLPAEITARRRQYEHYRDRLLTFKQAA